MLDDYHTSLPDILGLLQKEHDQLKAELDAELAITHELETCDQDELEGLRAELQEQRYSFCRHS